MRIRATTVAAMAFRRQGGRLRFLMLKRTLKLGGFWQSVSGRAGPRELAEKAAVRETVEETGLRVKRCLPLDCVNVFYYGGVVYLEPCFGVEVGEGPVRLSSEHTEYRWTSFREAMRVLRYPGNRAALRELKAELRRGQ